MHEQDLNRVVFYSREDMAVGYCLSNGEHILRNATKSDYENINDVLELYSIKKYIDNELYLKSWTEKDIADFKKKANEYGKIVGRFMSKINDDNVILYYKQLLLGYINSFWELINNQGVYKKISAENFVAILKDSLHEIRIILTYKDLVAHFDIVSKDFLLTHSQSAEILLSTYEEKDNFNNKKMYIPQSLTIKDKEKIILQYIDSENSNLNYLRLIHNVRNKNDFRISDRIRLKAKRKEKVETDKIFKEREDSSLQKYGVSIGFPTNTNKIKDHYREGSVENYSYSLDYIKQNNDIYSLFLNFKILFEFLDLQNRINLVSKKSQLDIINVIGIQSQNEYAGGIAFNMSEMTSHAQIVTYNKIINDLGNSLENILQAVFTSILQEKYKFANNARLSMSLATI